jgi:ectoine hydroxylase-related dioxygenase (phytanoyl-CoA dioxygenase family)
MPLQKATVENGCMHIIPGSHRRPVMAHRSLNNDPRIHALECVGDFDPRTAVACPVPAGGAMIHHCRTLHSAGANRSDTPRLAYILAFGVQNAAGVRAEPYSWNLAKRTPAQARADAWVNRGGAIGRKSRAVTASMRKLAGLARRAMMKRN